VANPAPLLDFVVLTHACSTLLASILAPTMLAEVGVAFSTTIAPFVVLAQPEFALFAMSPVVFGTLRKMLTLHCFILGKKKASRAPNSVYIVRSQAKHSPN
jgi:hypothetical protein